MVQIRPIRHLWFKLTQKYWNLQLQSHFSLWLCQRLDILLKYIGSALQLKATKFMNNSTLSTHNFAAFDLDIQLPEKKSRYMESKLEIHPSAPSLSHELREQVHLDFWNATVVR